jgi:hypothetical protein
LWGVDVDIWVFVSRFPVGRARLRMFTAVGRS